MSYLYEHVRRVPEITDAQIAEMRHIEPVLRMESGMYCRIKGADTIHPRNQSFLWEASPVGGEFTFDCLNMSQIITQHTGSYFFKPSLNEVYAWIRVYLGDGWRNVRFFCLGEPTRIGGTTDDWCNCTIMGGNMPSSWQGIGARLL